MFGWSSLLDERVPRGELGLGVRERGLGLGGELAALRGVVGRERVVDVVRRSATPPAASEISSCHDRSVSISSPSSVGLAVAQRLDRAPTAPASRPRWRRRSRTAAGCRCPARPACASAQRPSATFARVASRFSGATYEFAASCSCARVVRTVVDSVSRADVAQHEIDVVGRARPRHPASDPTPHPTRASGRAGRRCRARCAIAVPASARRGGSSRTRGRRRSAARGRGAAMPCELGHLGEVAVDVELDVVHARRARRPSSDVEADAEAVRADRRVVGRGGLRDRETRDRARRRPLRSPATSVLTPAVSSHFFAHVPSSRPLVFSSSDEQVAQLGVAPLVLLEVRGDAGEELPRCRPRRRAA